MKAPIQKISIGITSLCLALFATIANAQWTNIGNLPDRKFYDISFPSEQVGFAIVSGAFLTHLYTTTDGGDNWTELTINLAPVMNVVLQSTFFTSDDVGYLVLRGDNPTLMSFVYKTTDAGLNWSDITPFGFSLGYGSADVYFTNASNGYVSMGSKLYTTTNAGTNWTVQNFAPNTGIGQVDFVDANNGIMGAWDGTFAYRGSIYSTTDGGLSWDSLYIAQNYTTIRAVDYAGTNTAYAMTEQAWGTTQKFYKTTDNGATWDTLHINVLADSADQANDFYFLDENVGYLTTTNGYVYKTADGAATWAIDHFEIPGLSIIASSGVSLFVGGPNLTLLELVLDVGMAEHKEAVGGGVYPNPCSRNGVVHFKQPISGAVTVADISGKVMAKLLLKEASSISLTSMQLSSGTYFIVPSDSEQRAVGVVVE